MTAPQTTVHFPDTPAFPTRQWQTPQGCDWELERTDALCVGVRCLTHRTKVGYIRGDDGGWRVHGVHHLLAGYKPGATLTEMLDKLASIHFIMYHKPDVSRPKAELDAWFA